MTDKYLKIFNSFLSEHEQYEDRNNADLQEYFYENYYLPLNIENIKNNTISEEVFSLAILINNNDTVSKIIQNSYNILSVKGKKFNDGVMSESFIDSINSYKNQLELFIWINMNSSYNLSESTHKDTFRSWLNNKVITNIKNHFKKED